MGKRHLGRVARLIAKSAVFAAISLPALSQAGIVSVGFEQFSDNDSLTSQVGGVVFSHASVVSAGLSLNEAEFPPHAGSNVVFDDGGFITISFLSAVYSVSAYITYNSSSRLAFDVFDASDQLLTHIDSLYASNLRLSGDLGSSPNELFGYSATLGNISKVVITGDAAGASFVMDDLSFDNGVVTTVPEPATLALVALVLGAGCLPGGWLSRRKSLQ